MRLDLTYSREEDNNLPIRTIMKIKLTWDLQCFKKNPEIKILRSGDVYKCENQLYLISKNVLPFVLDIVARS